MPSGKRPEAVHTWNRQIGEVKTMKSCAYEARVPDGKLPGHLQMQRLGTHKPELFLPNRKSKRRASEVK